MRQLISREWAIACAAIEALAGIEPRLAADEALRRKTGLLKREDGEFVHAPCLAFELLGVILAVQSTSTLPELKRILVLCREEHERIGTYADQILAVVHQLEARELAERVRLAIAYTVDFPLSWNLRETLAASLVESGASRSSVEAILRD